MLVFIVVVFNNETNNQHIHEPSMSALTINEYTMNQHANEHIYCY